MRNFGNFFACFFFCSEHVRKHLNQLCSNLPRAGPKARGRNEIRKLQLQLQLQLLCKIRARSRINKRELPEKRMRNVSRDPAGKNPGCIWLDSLGLHYVNKSIPRSFQFGLKEKLKRHRSVWFCSSPHLSVPFLSVALCQFFAPLPPNHPTFVPLATRGKVHVFSHCTEGRSRYYIHFAVIGFATVRQRGNGQGGKVARGGAEKPPMEKFLQLRLGQAEANQSQALASQ